MSVSPSRFTSISFSPEISYLYSLNLPSIILSISFLEVIDLYIPKNGLIESILKLLFFFGGKSKSCVRKSVISFAIFLLSVSLLLLIAYPTPNSLL